MFVLLRDSARDGRKGDKLAARWLGPYSWERTLLLSNLSTGHTLKKKGSIDVIIWAI